MQLPGGFQSLHDDSPVRITPAGLSGRDEMAVWDIIHSGGPVSTARSELLDRIFDINPDGRTAFDLCEADQQHLLAEFARSKGQNLYWISAICPACDAPFDVPIDLDSLPVKPAGPGYPFASTRHTSGDIKCRVPTARDVQAVMHLDDHTAVRELIKACVMEDLPDKELNDELIDRIDHAIENCAPEIPDSVISACPECAAESQIKFDLMAHISTGFSNPLSDVHILASHYHWTEDQILDLPQGRREQYLDLIDQDQAGQH